MDKIIDKLKELKNISPETGFVRQSLEIILSVSQSKRSILGHLLESFRYSLALSLGAILLVIGLGGFSYLHLNDLSPVLVGSLNSKNLLSEAQKTDFSIKLAEAKYFDDAASAATIALNAISQNNPDHLNDEVLEKELEIIEMGKPQGNDSENIFDNFVL